MRHFHRIFFAAIAVPVIVYGRLGETEQELANRFGPPISRGTEITLTQGRIIVFGAKIAFRQGDWTIECAVIDGRCAREVYSKPGDWTEDQFVTVLSSNAQGDQWMDVSKEMIRKLAREWHRGDGAVAVWHMGMGMVVANPAYDRAKERAEAKAKSDASQIPKI